MGRVKSALQAKEFLMDNVEIKKILEALLESLKSDIEFSDILKNELENRGIDISRYTDIIHNDENTKAKIELLSLMIEILKKN